MMFVVFCARDGNCVTCGEMNSEVVWMLVQIVVLLPAVVIAAAGALELVCAMFVGCSGGNSIFFPLSLFVRYVCCVDNAFLYGPA